MNNQGDSNSNNIKQFIIKSLLICLMGGFMYILLINISNITNFIHKIILILTPFIYGVVLAYLEYPLYNKIRTNLKRIKTNKEFKVISIILTEALILIVISSIVIAIIPKFIQSMTDIINSVPIFLNKIESYIAEIQIKSPDISNYILNIISNLESSMTSNIEEKLISVFSSYMAKVAELLKSAGTIILNLIMGIVISILLLFNKENIFSNISHIAVSILPSKVYRIIKEELNVIHSMISGFFIGKTIDSLIVGIICFAVCKCLNMPYALVVAVIVGITNIIPIFGPFIGAVPSIFIVLSVDPIKAIELAVFIFILQQFDGNILGPKLLGNSTGMSTLWIILAITLFGGLFGMTGMILGVPLVAVIKDISTKLINYYIDNKSCKTEHNKSK